MAFQRYDAKGVRLPYDEKVFKSVVAFYRPTDKPAAYYIEREHALGKLLSRQAPDGSFPTNSLAVRKTWNSQRHKPGFWTCMTLVTLMGAGSYAPLVANAIDAALEWYYRNLERVMNNPLRVWAALQVEPVAISLYAPNTVLETLRTTEPEIMAAQESVMLMQMALLKTVPL